MSRLFGTDGVRGVANKKLTPELAFQIGQAAGALLRQEGAERVVVARDTRRSGPMLGAALAAGFCSAGIDVDAIGVAPTAAISYLVRTHGYGMGVVISASHNPAPDNGIKLFAPDGRKLPEAEERWIEEHLGRELEERPVGTGVGRLRQPSELLEDYEQWLMGLCPRLEGMRLCVDAAHGAGYRAGVDILTRLGAEVVAHGVDPDGDNINVRCGATHPAHIQQATVACGAVLGIAYDGDADRAVFSDGRGRLINGDRTMAIWARHEQAQGRLEPPVAVGTVMSNGGFEHFLSEQGIRLERAPVGDKYVAERIAETGARIGGEQSGHIIFPHLGPTGDGLATALELIRVLVESGKSAADWYDQFENWPQVLINLEVEHKQGWETNPRISQAIVAAEARLADHGRVNVRASGTQPILRLMVEADHESERDEVADQLQAILLAELGGHVYSRVDLTHALGD